MSVFDIILYGATGFTGSRAAAYLAENAPASVRWAVAGRDPKRLERIAKEVGSHGLIVADSNDAQSVDDMVSQARVVATTAGPFLRYGTPVVAACVEHGVDYVDITGETPWVRDLIERYHGRASDDGTRIVPFCGCDSIPSDIGALLVAEHFRQKGLATATVSASFKMSGGLNGGTLATAMTIAEAGRRKDLADWFALNPTGFRSSAKASDSRDLTSVVWDEPRQSWLMPFVMAPINTRVVRRSNGLFAQYGQPYGPAFVYQEAMESKGRGKAWATTAALGVADQLLKRPLGRRVLSRVGPSPGQGPSEATMDGGFLRVRLLGTADDGSQVMITMKSDGDPGNRYTVMALCESALLLATQRGELPGGESRGGILTPATALGLPLARRLETAGVEITTDDLT